MTSKKTAGTKERRKRSKRTCHNVRIIVNPGKTVTWRTFCKFNPHSLAVDGYCVGRPRSTPCKTVRCINHHEDVDRLSTRASVGQVCMLLAAGLVPLLTVNGVYTVDVYVNDCDQDVVWSTYALKYPEHVSHPMFQQLSSLADKLDTTMGFYPVKKRWHLLRRLVWISEPYTTARAEGRLHPKRNKHELRAEMEAIISSCHHRIRDSLFGRGKQIEPDAAFEVLEDFGKWQLIHEIGPEARLAIAASGILAYVGIVGPQTEKGPWRYVVHRRSELVQFFPVGKILRRLNVAEGYAAEDPNGWGGSGDNGGGSPREKGSMNPPDRVCATVKECLSESAF